MGARNAKKQASPYEGLADRAFWRTGVADAGSYPPPEIYTPRFKISKKLPIFTAGSCFAQHVGRTLSANGFNVIDTEPVPRRTLPQVAQKYGYTLYSARYGNIYTVQQFLQLLLECRGEFTPADPVWEKDGRYYDAMRPGTEPDGLATPELVQKSRAYHLKAVRDALEQAGLVVFTLGLTESWQHTESKTVYPTAPGTIAGQMDHDVYSFVNYRAAEIRDAFIAARDILRGINPDMKFLLTVSPVPLTATASGNHVLPATVYSKSVLRTVAGELSEDFEDVDYFPSYEIVTSHATDEPFFEPNLRSVSPDGVERVMKTFLSAHGALRGDRANKRRKLRNKAKETEEDVVCEEALLEAFNK
ncbi:GSCFA domain-containing protein [Actibacterium lipolyticum]|uniref:GSCFA family protein n=1 Tax=Actibacterium lipolyticum TaxID=1524263 RepID=A0A238KM92_9RHOB|nr:GSCFA domain-containing protein [Actibacterium lipolyticum]SMX43969.1 GSCFA family protein [Actibacterium lipolyticum]